MRVQVQRDVIVMKVDSDVSTAAHGAISPEFQLVPTLTSAFRVLKCGGAYYYYYY